MTYQRISFLVREVPDQKETTYTACQKCPKSTRNARKGGENHELLLISFKCIFQLFGEEALLPDLQVNGGI